MRKDIIATVFLILTLAFIATGCVRQSNAPPDPASPRALTAVAGVVTVEHLRYLPYAGCALIVAGILAGVFRRGEAGIVLSFGGAGLVGLYVASSEFPLSIAGLTMALCLTGCALAILWMLERRKRLDVAGALKETVAVLQPHKELRAGMCDGDAERQNEIRPIIDPLKAELREEGRI